jgi:hypothetical protein
VNGAEHGQSITVTGTLVLAMIMVSSVRQSAAASGLTEYMRALAITPRMASVL